MAYRILRELGRGGMGAVYAGLQVELNRQVAIKFLTGLSARVGDPGADRFLREMKVLQGLAHPGIVRFLDAGIDDGRPFLVMELLDGSDLMAVLRQHGALSIDVALATIEQVLDAVAYIHERGLVHRDIKPANILVDRHGRAVLGDFGLVKVSGATLLTADGHAMGTLLYVPPEVVEGGEATTASDLWACGAVLYEMLAGHAAFGAPTIPEVCHAIVRGRPTALELLRTDVPPELCRIVDRFLEKDPAGRWPDARAARDALEELRVARAVPATGQHTLAQLAAGSFAPPPAAKPAATRPERVLQGSLDRAPSAPRGRRSALSLIDPRSLRRIAAVPFVLAALAVVGFGLMRPVPVDEPADVRAEWTGLDRLQVTFRTRDSARWELAGDGTALASDDEARREHRLEGRAGFPAAPARVELVHGAQRRRVAVPPAPAARAESLVRFLRTERVDRRSSDALWKAIRTSGLGDSSASLEPAEARLALRRMPELVPPIRALIDKEAARVRGQFEAVRSFVAPLLMDGSTPAELRADLLDALGRLDAIDAVASYLALPVPLDVQAAMRPAVAAWGVDGGDRPLPEGQSVARYPPQGVTGALIFLPDEVPAGGSPMSGLVGDLLIKTKSRFIGRALVGRVEFEGPPLVSPGQQKLVVRLSHLFPHMTLLVDVPGLGAPVPVRFPNGSPHASSRSSWLSLELRGALAHGGGRWALRQSRAFLTAGQPYIVLDRILAPKAP